jgi:hypothetical protein
VELPGGKTKEHGIPTYDVMLLEHLAMPNALLLAPSISQLGASASERRASSCSDLPPAPGFLGVGSGIKSEDSLAVLSEEEFPEPAPQKPYAQPSKNANIAGAHDPPNWPVSLPAPALAIEETTAPFGEDPSQVPVLPALPSPKHAQAKASAGSHPYRVGAVSPQGELEQPSSSRDQSDLQLSDVFSQPSVMSDDGLQVVNFEQHC